MLDQSERQKYIDRIEELPQKVDATVSGLTDHQMETTYREGGWTVRQLVHHLADSHVNGYVRMKLVATEERPLLKTYEQNLWSLLQDVKMPLESSLSVLRGLHQRWVVFLRSISPEDWSRMGIRSNGSETTLDDMLAGYARHGENHLAQIRKALEAKSRG